jgi:hypothetical protein
MATSSDAALALAARLRALGDDELVALLRVRDIRDSGIRDYFDLADRLRDPQSLRVALENLDRPTLATIAVIAELSAEADGAALVTTVEVDARLASFGAPFSSTQRHADIASQLALITNVDGYLAADDAVIASFRSWPSQGLPGTAELASAQPAGLAALGNVDQPSIDSLAAEKAFATTTAVGELIAALLQEPARELARGGIALPDLRRLALATASTTDGVPAIVSVAARAGLIAVDGGRWLATADKATWLLGTSTERWAHLSGAWLESLSGDVRELLRARAHALWGDHFDAFIDWLYPAGSEQMQRRIALYAAQAELLGIVSSNLPSTPGSMLLAHGATTAAASMDALFPKQITAVYLQHDLTIVSPGPLEPHLDAQLRAFSTVESRGLAASYRVSSASLNRAMASGETAETITEFLTSIALTGIPQPLEYLIAETAARYGLVRVSAFGDSAPIDDSDAAHARPTGALGRPRASIRSADSGLLEAMLVDQSLSALALRRVAADHLTSRFDAPAVFWSLSDARYPVAAENESGTIVVLERWRTAKPPAPAGPDAAQNVVARLRLLGEDVPEETGRAWLERQLDVAIKAKALIVVTITMNDETTLDYLVQPTSLAGGRLRALDRKSDIERTLPVSHISGVRSAD